MPKVFSGTLAALLLEDVLTLATCVIISRKDGVVLGMTSHDQDLLVDGVICYSAASANASAVKMTDSTGIDNMEIAGILSDDRIKESDIIAGLYSSATITVLQVDWTYPSGGSNILLKGVIGDIRLTDGQFVVEVRSKMSFLKQIVVESSSIACRAKRLGDFRCQLNIATFTTTGTIDTVYPSGHTISSVSYELRIAGADLHSTLKTVDGSYEYGLLQIDSGDNETLVREIKRYTYDGGYGYFQLREPFPFALAGGEDMTVIIGCDRQFSTCHTKFANTANFQGEPHIPGNAKVTQIARPPR